MNPNFSERIISETIDVVREYKKGIFTGIKNIVCDTGYDENNLKIGRVRILRFFYITYEVDEQICLYNVLDVENGVVVIAKFFKWGYKKYHIFVAPYDTNLEIHGPFTLLGAIE